MHRTQRARTTTIIIAVALVTVAALVVRSPLAGRFGGASRAERVVTDVGRRSAVRLGDGTRVDLSVASTLVHPPTFAAGPREVMLTGEAFFMVAPDSARPFAVTASYAIIESHAGSFAVRVDEGDRGVRVVVAEGEARARLATGGSRSGTPIRAGHAARITRRGAVSRQDGVNVERLTAWRRGRIIFAGVPLRDAIVELARWHDVDLRIGDSVVANRRVTAEFTATQTLTEVLDEIALGIGAVYGTKGQVVTFRRER